VVVVEPPCGPLSVIVTPPSPLPLREKNTCPEIALDAGDVLQTPPILLPLQVTGAAAA
jgi:hypothetical protein